VSLIVSAGTTIIIGVREDILMKIFARIFVVTSNAIIF
jgi:hypothetical protein